MLCNTEEEAWDELCKIPGYNQDHKTIDVIGTDGVLYRIHNRLVAAVVGIIPHNNGYYATYCWHKQNWDRDSHGSYFRQQLYLYHWMTSAANIVKSEAMMEWHNRL